MNPQEVVASQSLRALIVDDHADTAELFQVLLTKQGVNVVVAGTLEDALDAINTHGFDVLISDIDLPDGNGCDLLEKIRQSQPLPAIAVSGLGSESILNRCKEVGFDEVFVKPASFQRVIEATLRLLAKDEVRL